VTRLNAVISKYRLSGASREESVRGASRAA
jgi:hypothetical protein